jgi:hypothetical protein
VSAPLGHASVAFTLGTYIENVPELDRTAAEQVSRWFSSPCPPRPPTAPTRARAVPLKLNGVPTGTWPGERQYRGWGLRHKLITVWVRGDWPPGLLAGVVGIDLVGVSEATAR